MCCRVGLLLLGGKLQGLPRPAHLFYLAIGPRCHLEISWFQLYFLGCFQRPLSMSSLEGETLMVNKRLWLLAKASHSSPVATRQLLVSDVTSILNLHSPDVMKQRLLKVMWEIRR